MLHCRLTDCRNVKFTHGGHHLQRTPGLWSGKKADRSDPGIGRKGSLKNLDDVSRQASPVQLRQNLFEIGYALIRCDRDDLLGTEWFANP